MRATTFGKVATLGMPVTLARMPPPAVHELGGEGRVKSPWRVTKIPEHWCPPAAIDPAGAAVPVLDVPLPFSPVCAKVKCVESGADATTNVPLNGVAPP